MSKNSERRFSVIVYMDVTAENPEAALKQTQELVGPIGGDTSDDIYCFACGEKVDEIGRCPSEVMTGACEEAGNA